MNILVQKFGGTSVESYERMNQVCEIIKNKKDEGYDMVVVVSAMGRKGAPYATDTLIGLCEEANENLSARELDIMMSCGEIISGTVLVHILQSHGMDAVFLTGIQAGIVTTNKFGDARIIDINTDRMNAELTNGKVVVISGFQGGTVEGEITTLGRGGSDTSAVAIGKALEAKTVEIYTDVDGIMTADPRLEPDAKVLDTLDYEEVFQMADQGAKVIHPRAVEIAKSGNIVLKIKNTLNPSHPGTKILGVAPKFETKIVSENPKLVTAVAHKMGLTQVKIKSDECKFTTILDDIQKSGISIDMINFFIKEKAFIIDNTKLNQLKVILDRYSVEYAVEQNCAKVTLIGTKIADVPGVMASIVTALYDSNVELLQTSDSHMTISCLIKESCVKAAIHAMHKKFNLI